MHNRLMLSTFEHSLCKLNQADIVDTKQECSKRILLVLILFRLVSLEISVDAA